MVAYGGGVNSTAMLIGCVERGEPIDAILFADTGGEKPATYHYLWTFSRWLEERGHVLRIVNNNQRSIDDSLEAECLRRANLPSKTYGFSKCSEKWKIRPQERYATEWDTARATWRAHGKVTKLIGIDAGEAHRAKITETEKYLYRYPLIEWDWSRDECETAIMRAGLPIPPKSACFYCPSSKKPEVLKLRREEPHLFDRAVALEQHALESGQLTKIVGLGRHWSWKTLVEVDEAQRDLFPEPTESSCVCYDGE